MSVSDTVRQSPDPGRRLLSFRGDVLAFRLHVSDAAAGSAWLRTNIGHAHIARREIIRHVDANEATMHMDWFDLPMVRIDATTFELVLPLCEVGHFLAKAYFLPDSDGQPVWPHGEDTAINVEPAETVCGNIVYNAFVRQFGPNKHHRQELTEDIDFRHLDEEGYTIIPKSGTFRDFIGELDFIVHELGCRYIQLLPINPTPTTYGRMGRFGSPYAAQSFKLVDTALAEFDSRATPLEQFMELVDAIHSRHAKLILDIAINHTGWGARLHETHPHWVKRTEDGRIEVPGAWGVWWEDLTKLDYSHQDLWQFMAGVFLTWCRRGVDGFRCDAGYMIPSAAWRYIIARVREEYPDTLFFLEGLGGKISVTRDLLNRANFNWAYSELFQNYDRDQIENYLPEADDISETDGLTIHYAETHDNNRMAATSETYASMRTTLCAMLSHCGGFGFSNGAEWFATEKIDVHDATPLNWGAEKNQVDHIRRITTILKIHPAFFNGAVLDFVQEGKGNFLAVRRYHRPSGKELLIVANLDHQNGVHARWRKDSVMTLINGRYFIDLITGDRIETGEDENFSTFLDAGQVVCLSADPKDFEMISAGRSRIIEIPDHIFRQRLSAKVLEVFSYFNGTVHLGDYDPEDATALLKADPVDFCRRHNNGGESRVIEWQWPRDARREVVVPLDHFLLVRASFHFEARLVKNDKVVVVEHSTVDDKGGFFVLFLPVDAAGEHQSSVLDLTMYAESGCQHVKAALLYTGIPDKLRVEACFRRNRLTTEPCMLLGTNGAGAVMRASSWWGRLDSRYDALLAANMSTEMPVDRWIMLARCRAWVVYQDYSQEVRTDCIERFAFGYDSSGRWRFRIPTGLGRHIHFSIGMEMVSGENQMRIHFHRHSGRSVDQLEDHLKVRVIIRPDVENRSFHETTKAYAGPETIYPASIVSRESGFSFAPDGAHRLEIDMPEASFIYEPEWQYMVRRQLEAERGMDPESDLFSPGYFQADMAGGQTFVMDARTGGDGAIARISMLSAMTFDWENSPESLDVGSAMKAAMDYYVVDRQRFKSVIAGYPWFLDWGRDSLIFCRGLIAAEKFDEAKAVIELFGRFEENGTLPNMICGEDATNRDTSDAPLWFMVVCRDYIQKAGESFLDENCGGRTIREILFAIAAGYARGTPNGVGMDRKTGLIYSPSHFTWMDTNFPAGSPRQGYPIEIQALWYAGLECISGIKPPEGFDKNVIDPADIKGRVASSLMTRFYSKEQGYLSDCLHCGPDVSPEDAVADDALRPNQLFAITLGAVADSGACRTILDACSELVVPGAIRSLADRAVEYPLEIRHDGKTYGDPHRPYRGTYVGGEDNRRKPAYHNGTAWTWVFPSFCEAWAMVYGNEGRDTALSWLSSSTALINQNCVGHMPEIVDGDYPHNQRGCDAQAWGVSELYRVWALLKD